MPTDPTGPIDEGPEPFSDTSWIESSERRLRTRSVVLGTIVILSILGLIFGLLADDNLLLIVRTTREHGFIDAIPRLWSPRILHGLGLEMFLAVFTFAGLLALAWWQKPPDAPEPPTVLTWLIAILITAVIICGEWGAMIAAPTTGPAALAIWFFTVLGSILGIAVNILWVFQPWFEYFRHLYCRWIYKKSRECRHWTKIHRAACAQWRFNSTLECVQYWEREYQECVAYDIVLKHECAQWNGDSCDGWPYGVRWLCEAGSWVAEKSCTLWRVCQTRICVIWKRFREYWCLVWHLFITAVCSLWYWFIQRICTLFFFVLKVLGLLCWWK